MKLGVTNIQQTKSGLCTGQSAAITIAVTALWLMLLKRLKYPVLYTYVRTGDSQALVVQDIHTVILLASTCLLLMAYSRWGSSMLQRRWPIALAGIACATGIALLGFTDYATASSVTHAHIGSFLVAASVPFLVLYWGLNLLHLENRSTLRTLAFSFALFACLYLALEAIGADGILVSIAAPLVAGLMVIALPASPGASEPTGKASKPSPTEQPPAELAHVMQRPESRQAPKDIATGTQGSSSTELLATEEKQAPQALEEAPRHGAKSFFHEGVEAHAAAFTRFAREYELSERETELAAYAYRNYSARRIAGELFIAESTVYTHLKRIYRKTGVHSKQELIDLIDRWTEDA